MSLENLAPSGVSTNFRFFSITYENWTYMIMHRRSGSVDIFFSFFVQLLWIEE